MEEVTATISGEGIDQLPLVLGSELLDVQTRNEGDVWLFFSGESHGMISSVVVCRVVSPSECHVRLVAGDIEVTLLNLNKMALKVIEGVCDERGWAITGISDDLGLSGVPGEVPEDDLSSSCKCLSCGGKIPEDAEKCPDCGWSYKQANGKD